MAEPTPDLRVGDRVSIPTFGTGIVRFCGPTQFQPGTWIGVQLDVAGTGKNDGSVKGVRYFTCDPNCGVFIRPPQASLLQRTTPSTDIPVEKPAPLIDPQKPPPLPPSGAFVTIPPSPPVEKPAAAPQSSPQNPPSSSSSTPSTPAVLPSSSPVASQTTPIASPPAAIPSSTPPPPSDARSPPQRGPLIAATNSSANANRPLSPAATISHLPPEVERRTAQQQRVQAELQERTRIMFNHVSDYVKSELAVTLEDYKMMETMNRVSKDKYSEMTQITEGLRGQMKQLESSYKELEPFLSKINDIEAGVVELEKAVAQLNAYAKRLEEKLRMPDKSSLAAGQIASPVKSTP